ncbi:MAG: glycosyltransferase family 61 protein [Deltaproteobacteria bacterium]|nr:glycosyltransferase family 61 protein [Deltaproteobacteria bacterium]
MKRFFEWLHDFIFVVRHALKDNSLKFRPGRISRNAPVILPPKKDSFGWCLTKNAYIAGPSHMVRTEDSIVFYDLNYWFDRKRYLPEYWLASVQIDECFGIIMMDTRIHYHNLKDILFQFFLMRKFNKNWKVIIFGRLSAVNLELLKAIEFRGTIFEMPRTLLAVHAKNFHSLDFTETNVLGKNSESIAPLFIEYSKVISNYFTQASTGLEATQLKLFSSRRTSERRPKNNSEVEKVFESYGYKIVDFGLLSFQEQIQLTRNAKVIAGPHGANLVNLIFAVPGTQIFEIMPSNFVVDCYEKLANIFNLPYHVMSGGDVIDKVFEVDIEKLKTSLQKIELKLKNS